MPPDPRALLHRRSVDSPVFKVEQGCPVKHGGCGCFGACHELIEVVRASEYHRLLGRIEQLELEITRIQGPGF